MSARIDRIRKLLNLANNASASENEADVARGLAEQLMAASGITEEDVAGIEQVDPSSTVAAEPGDMHDTFGNVVAAAVARIVGCFCYTTKIDAHRQRCRGCDQVAGPHDHFHEGGRVIMWVGTTDQRDTAIELHAWVCRQIDRLSIAARRTAKSSTSPRLWLNSYRLGLASAIAEQARSMVEYRAKYQPSTGSALVIQSNVMRKIDEHKRTLSLRKSSKASARSGEGFAAGKNDGKSIGLRRSVASSGQKRLGSG